MESIKILKKKITENNFLISEFKKTASKHFRCLIKDKEVIEKSNDRIRELKRENKELQNSIDSLQKTEETKK